MQQSQCYCCTDATVFRSAQCWTDHLLLCATMSFIPVTHKKLSGRHRRLNFFPLRNTTFASRFVDRVVHLVKSRWDDNADGLTKWSVVRDGLLDASTKMLGLSKRYQPDWFVEAGDVLRLLIDKRNNLFSLWLRSYNHRDRKKYLTQRHLVAQSMEV